MAKKNRRDRRAGRGQSAARRARAPLREPALLEQAFANHQQGNLVLAEQAYSRFLGLNPGHPEASHNLGLVKFQMGKPAEAVEPLRMALASGSEDPGLLLALGYVHRDLAQHEAARESLDALLQRPLPIELEVEARYALGTVCHEAGQLDEAKAAYEHVMKRAPGHAGAANSLGTLHLDEQAFDEALDCFDQALAAAPGHLLALSNRAQTLGWLGRAQEGLADIDRVLAARGDLPEAHSNRATLLRQLGRREEALAACRQALALRPDTAPVLLKMGLILTEMGRIRPAEAALRDCLELDPENHTASVELATNLVVMDEVIEARQWCERAIARHPDDPAAMVTMGVILAAEGRNEAAREQFEAALAIEPGIGNAWLQLSRMKRFTEADEPDIERVEAFADLPMDDDRAKAVWHYALGKMHQDRKRHEQAFGHYRRANDCMANVMPFRPDDFQQHLAVVREQLDERFYAERRAYGRPTRKPIFVFGMPRSGTTLVEQILSSHQSVHGGGELPILPKTTRRLAARVQHGNSYAPLLPLMSEAEYRALGDEIESYIDQLAPDAPHVTDKLPGNYMHLGLLALLFPSATFIHCTRHPMDVCLSNYVQLFAEGHNYTYSLTNLAAVYRVYHELMEHWKSVLPIDIHEVRYEHMVDDQEGTSRRLLAHCGLEWNDDVLRFEQNVRSVTTASQWQVRQPIYRSSVARWRAYEPYLTELSDGIGSAVLQAYEDGMAGNPDRE